VSRHCEINLSSAFAYFFFDGRDGQKESQTVGSLIRSLIAQFAASYGGIPATLAKLYQSCHDGRSQPSVQSLQSILFTILESFDDVYIILDALDECAKRNDVLKWIEEMTSWRKGKLHLLVTGRPEEDIAKRLRLLNSVNVYIKQDLITRDVKKYIDCILDDDVAFDRWSNKIKANIKNKLLESAGGMFVLFQLTKR
jgi:ankyrin repeat domain-containing protein 50